MATNAFFSLLLAFYLVVASNGEPIEIDLLENCANVIDLDSDSNGYIIVKDSGTKDINCELTIQCTKENLLSTRFLEMNFPTCDQSELELISVLEPNDQYPTFQSQPHFCGRVITDAVDFQQFGERKWKVVLKTKPKGVYSTAAFSFSVHNARKGPNWPPNKIPKPETTAAPTTTTTTPTTTTTTPTTTTTTPTTTTTTPTTTTTTPTTTTTTPTTTTTTPTTTTTIPTTTTTTTTTTPTTTTTTPTTTTIPTTTTTAPTYRCACPVSISDPVTNKRMANAPLVYLDEKTSHLWINITGAAGQSCDSSSVVDKCASACGGNAYKFYRVWGPLRAITTKDGRGYDILGDHVCEQTTQMAGYLSVYSQIEGCTEISEPAYTLDRQFYCYDGDYCSRKYTRSSSLSLWNTYDSCTEIMDTLDTLPTSKTPAVDTNMKEPTKKSSEFRCACPIAITDPTTGDIRADSPVVYISESSMQFNITTPTIQSCDSAYVEALCRLGCIRNVDGSSVSQFGPNRVIRNRPLGDVVCEKTEAEMKGELTVHSQVLYCKSAKISQSHYTLDKQFYCFEKSYCSHNYRRLQSLPVWSTYENCAEVMHVKDNPLTATKRCSCLVGVSPRRTYELEMTIEPKNMTGSCGRVINECDQYCRGQGNIHMASGGISQVVEKLDRFGALTPTLVQVNDLVCETLGMPSSVYVRSQFYSQVSGCIDTYMEGRSNTDKAVKLIHTMYPTSRCD